MIDLSRLTPEQLDKFLHMQSIIARQGEVAARVRALRDYYDGVMPVLLTDRQQEFIGKLMSEGEFEFAHNTIRSVIDTLRERLSVSGFAVNADDGAQTQDETAGEVAAQLWGWWKANRMDAQQIRLHRRALRDGKSYVMVDYDADHDRPRLTLHKLDDGTTGIQLHRDPENPERVLFANKYFYTFNPLEPGKTGTERRTTYLPGEIRKYIRSQSGTGPQWLQYADEDGGQWPLPWVDGNGEPLGVPVIEFENPGGSEVAQIIGLQDGLNKSWLDLIAAADAAGFPILAAEYDADNRFPGDATMTDDDDIDGADEFVIAPGRMLTIDGGKFHRIEGANLDQLIAVIWTFIAAISAVSRTPQYYLRPVGGSDVPSGEALKQLESGLVSRAEERQLIFGQAWADVMALAHKVQRTFGRAPVVEMDLMHIDTQWRAAEIRNETAQAQTAQAHKALGVPDEHVFALLGYSPQQIERFLATRRSDQAAQVATIAAALRTNGASNGTNPNNRPNEADA